MKLFQKLEKSKRMKTILSRKGFDSKYGGGSSPILPEGEMLSMPIPAFGNESGIQLRDVNFAGKAYMLISFFQSCNTFLNNQIPLSRCGFLEV